MQVVERESQELELRERDERKEEEEEEEQEVKHVEKVEVGFEQQVVGDSNNVIDNQSHERDVHLSMLQRLNPTNPLRIAINARTRTATPPPSRFAHAHNIRVGATPSPPQFSQPQTTPLHSQPQTTPQHSQPRSTPTPQVSFNKIEHDL